MITVDVYLVVNHEVADGTIRCHIPAGAVARVGEMYCYQYWELPVIRVTWAYTKDGTYAKLYVDASSIKEELKSQGLVF